MSLQKDPTLQKSNFRQKPVVSKNAPVLLKADKVDYDQDNDVVTATGHVEVSQGDTVILADEIIYDQGKNTVNAKGNISMLAPSGDVYFSDAAEFKDDLKAGVIHQFKVRLSDDSVATASAAHKLSEDVTELFKAAYTPCKCNDANGNATSPAWSIKAKQATIDNKAQEIRYDDAQFNVLDVPILYTPYFSHATPGADNESGLLMPSFLRSTTLGEVYKQPVYYAIAPDRDITLTPIATTKLGDVMDGVYREKFDSGMLNIQASLADAPNTNAEGEPDAGHQIRGNYNAKGDFKLSDNTDWGFDLRRATDDTYLHLYNFSNDSLLISRIYAEDHNFISDNDRNYASVEGLSFQGLTAQDSSKVIPVVAPLADVTWQSNPGLYNSRVSLEGNTMALYRISGDESRRVSGTAKWDMPYITDDGQAIQLEAQLRSDIYDVNNVPLANGGTYNGVTGREVPQVSALWHYPFIDQMKSSSVMLEPVVNVTVSPGGGNPEKIPNEDSLLSEFSDANLFSNDRFAGLDRIESGPRLSYGMRGQAQIDSKEYIDGLIGQQYRLDNDPSFPIANDLNTHWSDYVGKIGTTWQPFNLGYRFRLDQDNFSFNRSEWDAGYNLHPIAINASYMSLHDDPVLGSREVITGNGAINLSDEWSLTATSSRDLHLNQTVTAYSGLVYKNECATLTTVVGKDYTSLLDIKPSLSFWFRISLKNLE